MADQSVKKKEICLISHQTRQGIISSILGFEELCYVNYHKLKKQSASIIPCR